MVCFDGNRQNRKKSKIPFVCIILVHPKQLIFIKRATKSVGFVCLLCCCYCLSHLARGCLCEFINRSTFVLCSLLKCVFFFGFSTTHSLNHHGSSMTHTGVSSTPTVCLNFMMFFSFSFGFV